MNEQGAYECGSCGRMTRDGMKIEDRGDILAVMCRPCWDDFMGDPQ